MLCPSCKDNEIERAYQNEGRGWFLSLSIMSIGLDESLLRGNLFFGSSQNHDKKEVLLQCRLKNKSPKMEEKYSGKMVVVFISFWGLENREMEKSFLYIPSR